MELADVTDSKSVGSDTVRVQVPPPAPDQYNPNLFPLEDGLGFIFYLSYDCFGNGVVKRKTSKLRLVRRRKIKFLCRHLKHLLKQKQAASDRDKYSSS